MATHVGTKSPALSPRLPSPPPIPEVQIGPRSPTMNAAANIALPDLSPSDKKPPELVNITTVDNGSSRRIRPGTKAADMASGLPLIPLAELDSPFQLMEHLKALYYHHTKLDDSNVTMALSKETARLLAAPPEGVDRLLWLYELCRLLVSEVNSMVVAFFNESPPCSSVTCPEMRASEWQYLCAVHDPPKSCCAIDYCCHTLDWAANVLTSQKNFPSRLTLGTESAGGSQQGLRHLTNIFRRVYRIFAHAWFQHRASFWEVEGKRGLYILFKTVCDTYSLIPEENYTISPEAEGITMSPEDEKETRPILKKSEDEDIKPVETDIATTDSAGTTTRRHKHTPSTGSSVTTIAEGDEDGNHTNIPGNSREIPAEIVSNTALAAQSEPPLEEPVHEGVNPAEGIERPTEVRETSNNPANAKEIPEKPAPPETESLSFVDPSSQAPPLNHEVLNKNEEAKVLAPPADEKSVEKEASKDKST